MNNRIEDVLGKMKTLKDQMKQVSEDQNQIVDILQSIAEKQVSISKLKIITPCNFIIIKYAEK